MRRKDKEIRDKTDIETIIKRAMVCRLAMVDEGCPYVVPLCFGHSDDVLYFHSANMGKKLDILKKNDRVCFEFDIDLEVVPGGKGCEWGMRFKSVIGFGRAVFIENPESKQAALDIIMRQYTHETDTYPAKNIKNTAVIRVEIESMTGKRS